MALASPAAMIQFGLGGLIFSFSLVACVQIVVGPDIVAALLWSVAAAFAICFAISYQDRVAFAAANLTCATQAIKRYRETVGVAVTALLAQIMWLLIWITATLGVALQNHRWRQGTLPTSSRQYLSYEASAAYNPAEDDQETYRAWQSDYGGDRPSNRGLLETLRTSVGGAAERLLELGVRMAISNSTTAPGDDPFGLLTILYL